MSTCSLRENQYTGCIFGLSSTYAEVWNFALRLSADPFSRIHTGRFRDLVNRLGELYRAHIALEDSRLIEIGRRLSNETELAEIAKEMKARRSLAL